MEIKGINHLLFSVSHLDTSIDFYQKVFDAKLLVKGRTTAYFDMNGIWLALNEEPDIPRNDIKLSYTHIAFTIEDHEFEEVSAKLKRLHVNILPGRERDERDRKSIYFTDLTATNLNSIPEPFKTGFDITNKKKRICTFMMKRPFDITHHISYKVKFKEGCWWRLYVWRRFLPD